MVLYEEAATGSVLLVLRINRKTSISESLIFNKLQVWGLRLYEKRDSGTDSFLVILWNV